MKFSKPLSINFQKKFKKLFFQSIWKVGIVDLPIDKIKSNNYKVEWFNNSPKYFGFYADPFYLKIKNKNYLIFEDYSFILRKGRISIAEIQELKLVNKKIILEDKHLSYPYIIENNNKLYMICESYKSKNLGLYEINQENISLKFIKNIFENHEAIDPTIFKYNQNFWLFWSKIENANGELYLSYSNNLLNDFSPHPKNPIKVSNQSSRSAGNIFETNGKIFRPSQYCKKFYGEKIVINQILKLDEHDYQEKELYEISSTTNHNYKTKKMLGIHTITAYDNKTIIDGYFQIFAPIKIIIPLLRILKKMLLIKNFFDIFNRDKLIKKIM
jgi:hypothetical protein